MSTSGMLKMTPIEDSGVLNPRGLCIVHVRLVVDQLRSDAFTALVDTGATNTFIEPIGRPAEWLQDLGIPRLTGLDRRTGLKANGYLVHRISVETPLGELELSLPHGLRVLSRSLQDPQRRYVILIGQDVLAQLHFAQFGDRLAFEFKIPKTVQSGA